MNLDRTPVARALALYIFWISEFADAKRLEEIDRAMIPPPTWRDPDTGLPAGWSTEEDDWAQWERAMSR